MSAHAVSARPRARWDLRGIGIIAFAHGASDFYSGIVPLVVYAAVARAGLSAAAQGAIIFVWYVTSSIVQPLFGAYSDRRARWWYLPGAVALTVSAVSLAATLPPLPFFLVCMIVGGFGSAIMHPEAGRYTAQLSGDHKASGTSIFQIGGQAGYGLGPFVVALLLAHAGPGRGAILAIPGAISVALLFTVARGLADRAERRHATVTAALGASAADRVVIGLVIASTAFRYLAATAFVTYLPNVLAARGESIVATGSIATAFLLVAAVGLYAGGALADRIGPLPVTIGSLAAAVPFLAGFLIARGPLAIALLLCGGILLAMQNAPSVALLQAMLPRNLGMALGLINGVGFGIGSAFVAIVGVAVAVFGTTTALSFASGVPLLAALAYLAAGRRMRQARSR